MTETRTTIHVVDDDSSVRNSIKMMLESVGYTVTTYISARQFLDSHFRNDCGCIVLDVRMPGISGLELQAKLTSDHIPLPVIFITGHGTIPMSVRAMKAGAIDFLEKPFDEQKLLDAINRAIILHNEEESKKTMAYKLRQRIATLTAREQEVYCLLVAGLANKEIAFKLGTSERTIKFHRANLMKKMDSISLADLVRFDERLKSCPPELHHTR